MAFTQDHRNPVQLTGIARATFSAVFGESLVSSYLPVAQNDTLNYNFNLDSVGLLEAASFRSFNTESDVGYTEGGESRQGKLPPISRRLHVDEYAELVLQSSADGLGLKFEEYARLISAQIATRFVLAGAEAMETGKVTINERNMRATIDFGRKAGLTAVAPKVWTDATADPINDLETLRTVYGGAPGVLLIPEAALWALSRNPAIIALAYPTASTAPSRVSQDDVLSVLAAFGFRDVRTNSERLRDQTGTERFLFSQDKVLFLPSAGASALTQAAGTGPLGTTEIGIPTETLQPSNGISGAERAGLFAGAMPASDPEGFDVLVSAIGLPVARGSNLTASLKIA